MILDVRMQRKHPRAQPPVYATAYSACVDLFPVLGDESCPDGSPLTLEVHPGEVKAVRLGWAMQVITPQWCLELHSRSGQGKVQVRLANSTGIIDADFVGEMVALIENNGSETYTISEAKAVCQMKPAIAPRMKFIEVPALDATERGEGGFGSTDKA